MSNDFEIISIEEYSEEVLDTLTKDKLEEATTFVFSCDFDGDPYNYRVICEICIGNIKAKIIVNFGMDFVEQYVFDSPLKIEEYNSFLRNLETQDIRNVIQNSNRVEGILDESSIDLSSQFIIMDGRQTSSLYVKKGEELLFNGVVGKNLSIVKGQLEDSFIEFLPQYMKDAILDPEKFLNDRKISTPLPCCLNNSIIGEVVEDGQTVTYSGLNEDTTKYDDDRMV